MDRRIQAAKRAYEIIDRDLKTAGGVYDRETVMQLLGVTKNEVDSMVREDRILAVPILFDVRYPAFQFVEGEVLTGLRDVLKAFPSKNAWSRLNWLINPNGRLGGRVPWDMVKAGETELVVETARTYGEMGA